MKNKIIPQKPLVYFHKELDMNVTDSYRIAKKFQMTARNARSIVKAVYQSYLTIKEKVHIFAPSISLTKTDEKLVDAFDITKHIIPTKLKTDNNVTIDGYYLSEMGYTLVLQQISTPKLEKTKFIADLAKLEFSHAFFLMRDIIKNQPQPQLNFKEVITDNFGEISKANKVHGRTEEVRGYFRSDRNKKLSVLYGERKRLQNRVGGLFDTEMLEQMELIDAEIEKVQKTLIQKKLSNSIQSSRLLK